MYMFSNLLIISWVVGVNSLFAWLVFKNFLIYFCRCVYVCICAYTHVCRYLKPREVLDPLDLQLCVIGSHLAWILGTEQGPLEEQQAFLTSDLCLGFGFLRQSLTPSQTDPELSLKSPYWSQVQADPPALGS